MAKLKVEVPDIGDIDQVDVVEVLVSAGDRVAVDDSLISLESDKASMDVPSPAAGTVQEVKVKAGDQVGEGDLILVMDAEEEEAKQEAEPASDEKKTPSDKAASEREASEKEPESDERSGSETSGEAAPAAGGGESDGDERPEPDTSSSPAELDEFPFSKAYASPGVRRYARQLGVDLSQVKGSGRKGRILKEDVQGWVKKTLAEPGRGGGGGGFSLPEMPVVDFSRFGEVETRKLTRIQRISGPNLQRSWLHAPHVTQHDEADVTELEAFRNEHKGEAKERGFALTPLVFVMKAAVKALAEYPVVNSSLDSDGESLVLKKYYHLGIAVDTPEGLMVPVIRDVDQKGFFELAEELADVSARTRDKKLKPNELQGASFTISSLGGIGGTAFTPIVNTPEVAILGVSRSQMKPVWNGENFEPRLMLPVSLSYDHRVIDGALAVRFTTYLAKILGDIRQLLL